MHLHHCMENAGWFSRRFVHFLSIFHPARVGFPLFSNEMAINTTAVWKMLTNHELVVAWQLLEAVCPVLLTRGGIPRKGLTAQ